MTTKYIIVSLIPWKHKIVKCCSPNKLNPKGIDHTDIVKKLPHGRITIKQFRRYSK